MPATTPADLLADALAITAPEDRGRLPVLSSSLDLGTRATAVTGAVLHATSHGVYDARLDGRPVTTSLLNPGWTVYEHRLQVQSFDVTELVRTGGDRVQLDVTLAGGWWRGDLGFSGSPANYGEDLAFLAALEVTFTDGTVEYLRTDESWTSSLGPIELANLYQGQREDRRLAPTEPEPVRIVEIERSTLIPQASPPITRHESVAPQRIWSSPSGRTLVDFGQNLVGFLRFSVSGPAGTEITLRHAEVLEDEELGTRPLRGAAATDRIVLAGDPAGETFEPTLTFHGFRYAEVTGWPGDLTEQDIEAVVVGSDIRPTGTFESSHAGVNQLISNAIWSQRGNFLAVPTDCPQRDERLGWTGDIAAFAATAAFQFDVADFLHAWLLDLRAETAASPERVVPFVVPDLLKLVPRAADAEPSPSTPTAIWGDAAVWVAEALWSAYGDLERLREEYPGIALHLRSVEKALSPSGLWDTGFQFGDWLDPDASPHDPAAAKADKGVVATACLVRSARFAAEAARLLGEDADAAHWQRLAEDTLAAFTRAYVHEDGTITSDCATVYALAIAFDLLEAADRESAGARLAELVRAHDYRVSTGFAGTPFVTWALSGTGHVEDAYRLLLEEQCPSWLYPVSMGATTIWERWDSMLPDGSINPGEMTSFNHYALGAVADWIYQVVLGIRPAEPGYRRVQVQPVPGPGLEWVRGALDSPVGRIEVAWDKRADGMVHLDVRIPDGIPAEIITPEGAVHQVTGGRHSY
ncbi:alpha-L-rhamnosidase [Brachybacterium endophyticum]|uniref:alpha-L-rhamnosidase n=1 Tax=Brachybacterium endophyticum TaxID=2182385 RepID=A0A2U2RK75_9MICO|nr:alpha-L-rhamnosidase [Brachybacterium endophyticum]PWH06260.1 alpha-L-rhamnosidase [Brachybacterium endophyticum]